MPISRRKFIQLGSLASASLMLPQFLRGFESRPAILNTSGKILIVVQLSGGNDGLNTIIPYRNDIYYSSRPGLSIARAEALALTDDIGINPALKGLKQLYDDGSLCIVNGVGYPDPDRSHFRSMDIWQSGSTARELLTDGWLGRYLDNYSGDRNKHNAIAVEADDTLSLAMKGKEQSAIAVRDVNQFHRAATMPYFRKIATHADGHENELAGYLYKTLRSTTSAADYLFDQYKLSGSPRTYPDTNIGKRLKTIGTLIGSGAETQVFYVSHGSFDTHVGQKDRHTKLFTDLDDGLAALVADLKQSGRFNDVLIMTFSEFGRRVAQNGSNGTDHGTASSMMFIGGGLKKAGLYNDIPSLTDLDQGDLKYSIDFKQVYATVLDRWLQADVKQVFSRRYEMLNFI